MDDFENVGKVSEVYKRLGLGGEDETGIQPHTNEQSVFNQSTPDAIHHEGNDEEKADALPIMLSSDGSRVSGESADNQPLSMNQDSFAQTLTNDECASRLVSVQSVIEHLEQEVKSIVESSAKTAIEIREMHKLYHNEYAHRLKSMQDELDHYREVDKGRAFDSILSEVSKLYADNASVLDEIENLKIKKRMRYMFMDILQLLEANGVCIMKSNPGDKRNTRHCQIIERIPTDDPALHDTVASSRSTGFYIENRTLVKELVDIYLYTENNIHRTTEN